MESVAATLTRKGYWLRSGGAPGADMAFERGAVSPDKEIYIPWKSFTHFEPYRCHVLEDMDKKDEAARIAESLTKYWSRIRPGARSLLTRNVFQLLGQDLNTPSDFVVLWAIPKGSSVDGGSRIVYDLARQRGIPTFNLYYENCYEALMLMVNGL